MKFEIDLIKLIDNTITIQNYLFLQIVYHQDYESLKSYKAITDFYTRDDILFLMSLELIEFIEEEKGLYLNNLKTTIKFKELFLDIRGSSLPDEEEIEKKKKVIKNDNWMKDWYDLFPRGIKNGQYPIKGDRKGCFNKLNKFVKDYPEYSIDIIMKATKNYIDQSRLNNYRFMQQAHYFVSKNNMSTLSSYCEMILDKGEGSDGDGKVDYIDDI